MTASNSTDNNSADNTAPAKSRSVKSRSATSRSTGGNRRRAVAWIGIVTAAVALLVVAVVDQGGVESEVERVQRLNSTYACPTCDGQAVSDSNAPVSAVIRQYISDRVSDGATDVEIRDELVSAYTVEVLLNPPAEGFVALIWILPVIIAVMASVGVATAVTGRSSDSARRSISAEDRQYVERARAHLTDEAEPADNFETSEADGD